MTIRYTHATPMLTLYRRNVDSHNNPSKINVRIFQCYKHWNSSERYYVKVAFDTFIFVSFQTKHTKPGKYTKPIFTRADLLHSEVKMWKKYVEAQDNHGLQFSYI